MNKSPKLKYLASFLNAERVKYDIYLGPLGLKTREGDCEDPMLDHPKIRLDSRNKRKALLELILEEMLHAHDFNLTEKVVRKFTQNTADLLHQVGFRKVKKTKFKKRRS